MVQQQITTFLEAEVLPLHDETKKTIHVDESLGPRSKQVIINNLAYPAFYRACK
jgi:hypothetical protein